MRKPKVFILQKQTRYDTSAVKNYSNYPIYIINQEHISPFDNVGFMDLVKHRLIMEEFDPNIDFICLTGSSVLLSLFLAAIVAEHTYANLKLLIFDARNNKYRLRILGNS